MTTQKIISTQQFLEAAEVQRAAGRRIVFANGAFDLLHAGHVRYLEAAREEGDWLAKGTDYTAESVPERAAVAVYGGRTVIVGEPKDHATTNLIARVARALGVRG